MCNCRHITSSASVEPSGGDITNAATAEVVQAGLLKQVNHLKYPQ